jgi:hypothetical protein
MASLAQLCPKRAMQCFAAIAACAVVWPAYGQFQANRRPPRPEVTLPDGPVRQIIRSSCSACHGIDEYGYYAMDRDAWNALIDRMETASSGLVQGAEIADADREILLDWLVEKFGPDAEPFERQYVVRQVTDETRLSDARAMARFADACETCLGSLDRVLSIEFTADEWRTTLTGKMATGTPLLIDEVDPLIDWLLRSRNAP